MNGILPNSWETTSPVKWNSTQYLEPSSVSITNSIVQSVDVSRKWQYFVLSYFLPVALCSLVGLASCLVT